MKYYEDEEINIGSDIIFGIFMLASIYLILGIVGQYQNGDFGLSIFLIILAFFVCFLLLSSFIVLGNIINVFRNRKIVKKIKENGIKTTGKITRIIESDHNNYGRSILKKATYIRKNYMCKDNLGQVNKYSFASVKYELNGKSYTTTTPSLTFDKNYLDLKDVDVYVYNNQVYVDNYKIDVIKKVTNELNYLKTIILIIGLFFINIIICSFAIFLNYKNIINQNRVFLIFIILMIIYFIIISIIYYKNLFRKR